MKEQTIFQFQDPIEFMLHCFQRRRGSNPGYSLRAWSRQLGYRNPSLLSQVLNKRRKIKPTLAEKVAENLRLDKKERDHFFDLVDLADARAMPAGLERLQKKIEQNARNPMVQNLKVELFRLMADWMHVALLEATELKFFKSDPKWIAKLLGVTIPEVKMVIDRLVHLKLLALQKDRLKRVTDGSILVAGGVPNESIRMFHSQMIGKAQASIHHQENAIRDIRGTTIAIKKKDYVKIQESIVKFHAELQGYAANGDGELLYQINTQFFRLNQILPEGDL